MAEPIVQFQAVTKRFGDLVVLDALNLDVAPNEQLVIIGPSGSGKSTLLRLLMTLERPNDGHIKVDGDYLYHMERGGQLVPADLRHIRKVRGNIGMVFQQFNLFPHMTALRNVTEAPRHVLGLSREEARERAEELLGLVGLGGKLDSYPSQLSGGQQQRVAIARALAMRPRIMLFDEVTSALDPELVGEVLGVMRTLAVEHDQTMLIVTHEMSFARDIADRVCFFDKGRIVEQGPPARIFSEPTEERTREFLRAVLESGR
jgi:polar amino acid transport system ATP-binding protein